MYSSLLHAKVLIGFLGFREFQFYWRPCFQPVHELKPELSGFSLQTTLFAKVTYVHSAGLLKQCVQQEHFLFYPKRAPLELIFFQIQIEEKLIILFSLPPFFLPHLLFLLFLFLSF